MTSLRRGWQLFGTLGAIAAALGCAGTPRAEKTVPVVVTFYPLQEFAQRVGGERVRVVTLVPPGAEPHDYEPRPQDIIALHTARMMIYNGAGLEPWLEKVRPEFPTGGVVVNASDGLPLVKGVDEGEVGEPPARFDPHIWLDPLLAARMVTNIQKGLEGADPQHSEFYAANASKVEEELRTLHGEFDATLRTCRQKEFITTHAAFGYLARRYGLVQLAISGLSPEAEPAPARLRELVHLARDHHINVVYYETLVSPRVAEALAREVGARVLVLNPLEGLTGEELRQGLTYFSVMHETLRHLADGLGCRKI
ncbi:MAG: ABC transporter substrate-binding protein [Bacillati bacterium ANGP1]|uniref:ABC transporter substrate-binding protein n=1 Tax=Candidatus Segetimicrobium genomatis TaxID=2569760 RepID=A0A537LFB5_9BACT|nr:MAG: ABC transporter substrate-binding protein [Terrabacteria group bacterium ANGP1]